MARLVNAAKIASFAILKAHLTENFRINSLNNSEAGTIAAASVNFLFDEDPDPAHKDLDFQEIQTKSIEWLKRDDLLRELIVQSLRVIIKLEFMKNGTVSIRGEKILEEFGREHPIAPNPESYQNLVQKVISVAGLDN